MNRPANYRILPPVRVAWTRRKPSGRLVYGFTDVTPVWMQAGLAVTPTIDYPAHWSIVHVRSGWALVREISGQAYAIEAAQRFLMLGNFDRSRHLIQADHALVQECRTLQSRLIAEGLLPELEHVSASR